MKKFVLLILIAIYVIIDYFFDAFESKEAIKILSDIRMIAGVFILGWLFAFLEV